MKILLMEGISIVIENEEMSIEEYQALHSIIKNFVIENKKSQTISDINYDLPNKKKYFTYDDKIKIFDYFQNDISKIQNYYKFKNTSTAKKWKEQLNR